MLHQQVSSGSITLSPGTNTIPVTLPSGTMSVAVMLWGANLSSGSAEVSLRFSAPNANIDNEVYRRTPLRSVSNASFETVFLDVAPSTTSISIENQPTWQAAPTVTATITIVAYGCPAAALRTDRQLVERWGWVGWQCSNLNVFSVPSGSPSNVTMVLPVNAEIVLLGMHVDISMADNNSTTATFVEMLSLGGYQRQSEPTPYAVGGNASNPSNFSAPGFGAPSTDTGVNWGPNASAFPGTLFANILKSSAASIPNGANAHIYVDAHELRLEQYSSLWFHMAGQSEGGSSGSIDGEMQVTLRYALL